MEEFSIRDERFKRGIEHAKKKLFQDILPRNDSDFSLLLLKLAEDEPENLPFNSGFLLGVLCYSEIPAVVRSMYPLATTGTDFGRLDT